jgi:predicted AAA+ superfamily ATPase
MITRQINNELHRVLKEYPIVTLLGPRQAGKTTLAKSLGTDYDYCNLEIPEIRQFAQEDPNSFLAQFQGKVILDEIQRVPELLSYLQASVDEHHVNGRFIITGSHQLELRAAISQSLAGRTAILHLYPFSIAELLSADIELIDVNNTIYRGFLPRIYDQQQRPTLAYSNYYQTYVERDVRQLINVKDQTLFEKFMKLMAGRVGQLMDYSSLANDVGTSATTIKHWLSILEASFILYKLPPYYENFGKRLIKSPKYFFIDTGLLVFLLGIENTKQVARDPLIGQLFENLIVIECLKARANQGKLPNLYFYRDSNGNEVDIIVEQGRQLTAIEVKYSATYHSTLLKNLKKMINVSNKITHSYLVYNGKAMKFSDAITAVSFEQIEAIFTDP